MPLVAKLVPRPGPPSTSERKKDGSGAEILFSGVELVYPSRPERPAIHSLDLRIRAGEKVAFCGEFLRSSLFERTRLTRLLSFVAQVLREEGKARFSVSSLVSTRAQEEPSRSMVRISARPNSRITTAGWLSFLRMLSCTKDRLVASPYPPFLLSPSSPHPSFVSFARRYASTSP